MKYHWLAHHLVQERFPELSKETRDQIISEAVCRAWCSFLDLDYQLMQTCVNVAAQRKGLAPPRDVPPPSAQPPDRLKPRSASPHRATVIRMSDYR
jgi:hypothetical protein